MNQAKDIFRNTVFIDFETCGTPNAAGEFDVAAQRPVEVAAVQMRGGIVTGTLNTLIRYTGEWTKFLASDMNHHTQEELLNGMPESTVTEILYTWLFGQDEVPLVIAYNGLFDLQVLYEMLKRSEGQGEAGERVQRYLQEINLLDPLTVSRDRAPYPHKLGVMCKRYGIELTNAHSALEDCMALVELTEALQQERDISSYVNRVTYKRQYGMPAWAPKRITLEPIGHEFFEHKQDGTVAKRFGEKTSPKPYARLTARK